MYQISKEFIDKCRGSSIFFKKVLPIDGRTHGQGSILYSLNANVFGNVSNNGLANAFPTLRWWSVSKDGGSGVTTVFYGN